MKSLVITDLDNTLYDWVTFFARSFRRLTSRAAALLDVPESLILGEYHELHQILGTVEHPFALFELPVVRERYPDSSRLQVGRVLSPAFEGFSEERRRSLTLFPGVKQTLGALRSAGIPVVAHTEASEANSYYRLSLLGIADLIERIYVLESHPVAHPIEGRIEELKAPKGKIITIPKHERKPNPAVLLESAGKRALTGRKPSTSVTP